MFRYTLIGALLLSSAAALADGPSYSYIQAAYQEVDVDVGNGFDADGDGYAVGGSVELNDNWFVFAGYSSIDLESVIDFNTWTAGAGYHAPITAGKTDWFASLAYIDAEADAGGFGSADDSGFGIEAGIRSMLNEQFELYGSIGYSDLGDGADGTAFGAGFWYTVTGNLALGLGASVGEDVTSYGAGIRLYFDK